MSDSPGTIVIDSDVDVVMRDGVRLKADVYRPSGDGRHPALLQRTPYGRSSKENALLTLDVMRAVRAGYVVVIQDVRGRYRSEGAFVPFHNEIDDGYDTVEWCGSQPWSDGSVGMFGMSYVGATQWLAAISRPTCLRAIFPQITSAGYEDTWTHQGGAFELGLNLSWTMTSLAPDGFSRARRKDPELTAPYHRLIEQIDNMEAWFEALPPAEMPLFEPVAPYYKDWMNEGPDSSYWDPIRVEDNYDKVEVPAHILGGWFDSFLAGTLRNFEGLSRRADADAGGRRHRLTIGPWTHLTPLTHIAGEWSFGVAANPISVDVDGLQLAWFDQWLKEADVAPGDAPVKFFVMGIDKWREAESWPLPDTRFEGWWLAGDAAAGQGLIGPGLAPEGRDEFDSDPSDPVPTRGGGLCCWPALLPGGVFDQSSIEARDDVLVYTSDELAEDVCVVGPVSAVLYVSSTGPSADFCVKLIDVAPDGYARNLCDGICRWTAGERDDEVSPGVHRVEVDLIATANVFQAGHRVRVDIAGSNFPRFDRNPQTGEAAADAARLVPRRQTIFHDRDRRSHVLLPVVSLERGHASTSADQGDR